VKGKPDELAQSRASVALDHQRGAACGCEGVVGSVNGEWRVCEAGRGVCEGGVEGV
jgi:hypothetical protein